MRNRFALWLFAFAAPWICLPVEAAHCPPGWNLLDRDGNGLADYACVGDWDWSGACEMEQDIQAAVDALDDPGPKRVELSDCSFAPPVVAKGEKGIVELPSNLTLAGQGAATVLNGFSEFDFTSHHAVVTNERDLAGSRDITIRDLTIDGGWRQQGADSIGPHFRMGVFFDACDDCVVEDVTVKDTLHSCLYARNSTGVNFLNSTLRRCGNYEGTSGSTFSCVYLYASSGKTMQDALVMGIDCDGSGWSALNTRRENPTAIVRDIVFRNNTVRNTRIEDGAPKLCVMIRGVDGVLFENTTCINTGGLATHEATAYYSEGIDAESSASVIVDGLHLVNTHRTGMLLQGFVEGFTGRNITIDSTPDNHCVLFQGPQRDFLMEDVQLSNCGRRGVSEFGTVGSGANDNERMVLRRIRVTDAGSGAPGSSGLFFRGPASGLTLESVEVQGASGHGLEFDGFAEQLIIRDSTLLEVPLSGIALRGGCQNCMFDGNLVAAVGGDGLALDDTTVSQPNLANIDIRDNVFADIGGRAIAFAAGSVVGDVSIRGNDIDGTGGDGVDLETASSGESASLHVQGNTVSDFGRSGPARGIDVSGAIVGASVAGNRLETPAGQASAGIEHDVPGGDPFYLCFNSCGALTTADCLHVPGSPSYGSDQDADGVPDACGNPCPPGTDIDNDGFCTDFDNCALLPNPTQEDSDEDLVGDICDVCPFVHDPDQEDGDGDGRGDACTENPNLLVNGDFESGLLLPWMWFSDSPGTAVVADGAALVETFEIGSNVQFYQRGLGLSGGTTYRLVVDAACSNDGGECDLDPGSGGADVTVLLHIHDAPQTNYGLTWDLTLSPFLQTFATEFTAPAELPVVRNGRLRFWFADHGRPGNVYRFDRVILTKVPLCGDEWEDAGEACDDGNTIDIDSCRNDCSLSVCGDGVLWPGVEECDDGNAGARDGCEPDCTLTCRDTDGDGHGSPGNAFCAAGAEIDCDDDAATVYPGAAQICDGLNDDCNEVTWPALMPDNLDDDLDGFAVCQGDCDDLNAAVYPLAVETCNAVDDDCDGSIDEDASGNSGDADADLIGDGCDNCWVHPNPGQVDMDGDAVGNACDLDDGLIFLTLDGAQSLVWQAEIGFDAWNLYRGDVDTLRLTGAYTQPQASNPLAARECGLAAPLAVDAVALQSGKTAFYLISGVASGIESDLGADSTGTTRTNSEPCP